MTKHSQQVVYEKLQLSTNVSNPEGSTLQTSISPIAEAKGYKHLSRSASHLPLTLLQQKKLMLTC